MQFILSKKTLLAFLLAAWPNTTMVEGHGYMSEPPARNVIANMEGLHNGAQLGMPRAEYCPQCINQNAGVCGITQDGTTNYDAWLDSTGTPMPFVPQRTLVAGDVIDVRTKLTANHGGHMELRGCPMGRASTQACFDSYKFDFVSDEAYGMPRDLNYPERGYYWGGLGANYLDYHMRFRVPSGLVGQEVMLQWHYITANSCTPPGYAQYFSGQNSNNQPLPDVHWSPQIPICTMPLQNNGVGAPERFWNCAEVSVVGNGGAVVPVPVPVPVPAPTYQTEPVMAPTRPNLRPSAGSGGGSTGGSTGGGGGGGGGTCGAEWDSCYEDNNSCCAENYCEVHEWYAQCKRRADACLQEWNACNDNPNGCCPGYECKGFGWKQCRRA